MLRVVQSRLSLSLSFSPPSLHFLNAQPKKFKKFRISLHTHRAGEGKGNFHFQRRNQTLFNGNHYVNEENIDRCYLPPHHLALQDPQQRPDPSIGKRFKMQKDLVGPQKLQQQNKCGSEDFKGHTCQVKRHLRKVATAEKHLSFFQEAWGGRKGKTKIKGSKNRKWLLRRLSSKKNLTVCVNVRA